MKIESSKSYDGTCQACFRRQSTRHSQGVLLEEVLVLVHHGYERPGTGFIHGDCVGVGHEPYELSCEQTKVWRAAVAAQLATVTAEHQALEADKVETLYVHLVQGTTRRAEPAADAYGAWHPVVKQRWGTVGWQRVHLLTVRRDHVPVEARGESPGYFGRGAHDFAYYRARELQRQARTIAELTLELETLDRRVKEWVYAPERLTAYEGAKKAAVVHLANLRMGRPACTMRRGGRTTENPAEVTCTRCRARLPGATK